MIELIDRILLNDGVSIVDEDIIIKYLLDEGIVPKHIKTVESKDTDRFEKKYQTKITHPIEDIDLCPDKSFDEDLFNDVILELYNRKPDDVSSEDHDKRFEKEMSYFIENDHQKTIIMLYDLVKKFKESGIVWGVGRGSSVASYILYLVGIHDINCIKYDINPKEFYKSLDEQI